MVVQHNISAMNANRYYGINNKALAGSLEKLSSGYAINRAGDNAAGLAVSEKMRAQIGGLTQASKNAEDGISMVQTFEGALQETDSILQRMRSLATQSANGNYQNEVDRDAIQLEFDQLNDELNQIADTDFNGVVMLNGGVMADGTVANSYNKVADRPQIDQVSTDPDTSFTYKSIVNGTVDSAGNGSLAINGVSLKLTGGNGSATLSKGGNETKYSTVGALTVDNGKVNGKISAKETYKIDDKTTSIEIHGNAYQVKNDSLVDQNGYAVNTIDGLAVSVTKDSKVTLDGVYDVVDNEVKTQATFEDRSTGVGGVIDGTGKGKVVLNNTQISLAEGGNQETAGPVSDKTIPAIKYEVTDNFEVEEGVVSGEITVSGSVTKTSYDAATGAIKDGTLETTQHGVVDDEAGDAKLRFVSVGNGNIFGSKDGGSTWYSFTEDEANYILSGNKTSATAAGDYATVSGRFDDIQTAAKDANGTAIDDGTAKTALTGGYATLDANDNYNSNLAAASKAVKLDTTVKGTDEELDVLKTGYKVGDQVVELSLDGTKWADGAADTSTKAIDGKKGVVIDLSGNFKGTGEGGKIAVNKRADDAKNVGSFKLSKGVSTSDAYNHGTRNLTYADSMVLQVGARSKDAVDFNFSYATNGIGTLKSDLNASARGLGTDQLSVKSSEEANYAIDQIDNAINKVNMIRATFGSVQNRLEHKINTLDTNNENLTAAESRIRDTQMDKEMMKFTSSQILSQASQSMLAQANSLPQGVLQLLG